MSARYAVLIACAIPAIYYVLAIFSTLRYFRQSRRATKPEPSSFTPPISNLKPVRGLDPNAYENFASFCRQDYPEYELLFCTTDQTDPAVPVIQKLMRDFPDKKIRLLYSAGYQAINDKVAKLNVMTREAANDVLVINDSDVHVAPDYFRKVVEPLQNAKNGGVTCFYVSKNEPSFVDRLQSVGMLSDFYAGILVAWQLDGVQFALGPTMVSTKERIRGFGGFAALENRPADDLLFGRLIAEQGYNVVLLPYAVETVADFKGMGELIAKRLRWMTVMRNLRPWGHFGLLFTWGLPWACLAVALHPTAAVALGYWGVYAAMRAAMTWLVAGWGLRQAGILTKLLLIPIWDAFAFLIWLASFTRSSIRWRGTTYQMRDGHFVSAVDTRTSEISARND